MPARDPTTTYARDVLRGKAVAGRMVRLACQRHLEDVKAQKKKRLKWSREHALHAIDFFPETLRLADGRPFVLEPFQAFIVGSLFGWFNIAGFRRYRTAYVECGKGNGKSPLAAGIGLYGLLSDAQDEPEAEIYSAAVSREQAQIVFKDALSMVSRSPELVELVERNVGSLVVHPTASVFRPVSSEHRGLDGKRVHMALIDEIHEHPTDLVVEKMRAGTKTRRNALIFEITNSGYDRGSVCWSHHEYSEKILEGREENAAWFAYLCGLDEGDDWTDERVWEKANPGLDAILPREYLREQVKEAVGMPSKENIVKRLNFCVWTEQSSRWMPVEWWRQCSANEEMPLEELAGELGFAGLKLAISRDISAFVLVVPSRDRFHVYPWFWCPEADVEQRTHEGRPYRQWVEGGWLIQTEGDTTDFGLIEHEIANLFPKYGLRFGGVFFDAQSSSHLATRLTSERGMDYERVIRVNKTFASLSEATLHVERLFKSGVVAHGDHPVLFEMFKQVAVLRRDEDPDTGEGQLMIDRQHSGGNVVGMEALVMAIQGWLKHEKEEDEPKKAKGAVLW